MSRTKTKPEALPETAPNGRQDRGPDDPQVSREECQLLTVANLKLVVAKQNVELQAARLRQLDTERNARQAEFNQALSQILLSHGIEEANFSQYSLVGDNHGQVTGIQRRPVPA